jgi:hypothetical protein
LEDEQRPSKPHETVEVFDISVKGGGNPRKLSNYHFYGALVQEILEMDKIGTERCGFEKVLAGS